MELWVFHAYMYVCGLSQSTVRKTDTESIRERGRDYWSHGEIRNY